MNTSAGWVFCSGAVERLPFATMPFFLALVAILLLLALRWIYRARRHRQATQAKQYQDFLAVFARPAIVTPHVTFGSHYGWDSFEVLFHTHHDWQYAQQHHLFTEFKQRIAPYYSADFDADRAIYFGGQDVGRSDSPFWM
jgi:hypothetical protein